MRYSMNEVVPAPPWNLQVEIDGKVFNVRAWELRDTEMLATMETRDVDEGYKWFESLFDKEKPDVRSWNQEMAGNVVAVILGYRDAMLQKKRELLKQHVRAMAARN